MKCVQICISGTVQGVWFRESTKTEARRLGVHGWIRNLADGRVEAHLEGPARAVDELVEWCRQGPERARVDHLAIVEQPPRGDLNGFDVRR